MFTGIPRIPNTINNYITERWPENWPQFIYTPSSMGLDTTTGPIIFPA